MEYWKRLRQSVGNDLLILPGANVFIENEKGEILMHKGHHHSHWRFIGGLAEDNESLWQCAARETKEELNLDITDPVPFCFQDDPRTIKSIEQGDKCFFHTMSFWTKAYTGNLKLDPIEVKEVAWLDLEKEKKNLRPNAQKTVDAFLRWKETGQFQYITNK